LAAGGDVGGAMLAQPEASATASTAAAAARLRRTRGQAGRVIC
jgi:hypothetical protein